MNLLSVYITQYTLTQQNILSSAAHTATRIVLNRIIIRYKSSCMHGPIILSPEVEVHDASNTTRSIVVLLDSPKIA